MKICIDARFLQFGVDKGGIYQYILNLIQGLSKIDQENRYWMFFNFTRPSRWKSFNPLLEILPGGNFKPWISRVPKRIWHKYDLPLELLVGRVDVFHGTHDFVPRSLATRTVMTIHDLAHLRVPDSTSPDWIAFLSQSIPRSAKRATKIITVSQFSKRDIVELLGIPEEKVQVVYHGVREIFRPLSREEVFPATLQKYGIDPARDYILYVGTLKPTKNLPRLLEAYALLQRAYRIEADLVIAGQEGWFYEGIYEEVKRLELEDRVTFTGYVRDEDLPDLYSGAELFVLPSLLEGFGIPVLEAMACGTPVVASKAGSLPEVVGEAGVLVDPLCPEEMAQGIYTVLTDSSLREELREKGLDRAAWFTWERTARETLEVYRELINQ